MSKESMLLLRNAGYTVMRKMGKKKFIPVFRSLSSSTFAKKKRDRLITKIIIECFNDINITKRMRRSENDVNLTMKLNRILASPEYSEIKDEDTLRYVIAQLIVDEDHRAQAEKVIKENKKRQWPKFRPICGISRTKSPEKVLETIFSHYDKAWSVQKGRYCRTKAGTKFKKALRDLLSKDWLHNYSLLAGYVPVMKDRKLGEAGRLISMACGCRHMDQWAAKKEYLQKIRLEARNYRFHTVKRQLKRINTKTILKHKNMPSEDNYLLDRKSIRPGVWTRVFKASQSRVLKGGNVLSKQASEISEMSFMKKDLKDISSPQLATAIERTVAIKVYAMTPNIPMKLVPARVVTMVELSGVLDHPFVTPFLEAFATRWELFIVMPYAENRTLHHIINTHGRLMQKTARVWTFQIALAVQYLHAAGIIHRNIKCSNILITEHYEARLSGFGSAKVKWLDLLYLHVAESKNYNAGYRPYRAPEVLRRKPYFLPPIDVWSLGVVLFRMLNNCYPYCYHNKEVMYRQQMAREWRKNWKRESKVSESCLRALNKMLMPHAGKRIRIDDLVNHRWFADFPIPKAHRKAVRGAPFIFARKAEEADATSQPLSSYGKQDDREMLDEIYAVLEKIVTTDAEPRKFPPLQEKPAYQECFTRHMKPTNLLGSIDQKLRGRIRRRQRQRSWLQYEEYVSDQEKTEIQEKTDVEIEKLKKRTAEVRKHLDLPPVDERSRKVLVEVVQNVKDKHEKFKNRSEEMTKKLGIFMPKAAVDGELRSILQIKHTLKTDVKTVGLKTNITQSKDSVSTGNSYNESTARGSLVASSYTMTSTAPQQGGPLPKLGFVKQSINEDDESRPSRIMSYAGEASDVLIMEEDELEDLEYAEMLGPHYGEEVTGDSESILHSSNWSVATREETSD